jgi:hypothetical protein
MRLTKALVRIPRLQNAQAALSHQMITQQPDSAHFLQDGLTLLLAGTIRDCLDRLIWQAGATNLTGSDGNPFL